MIFAGENPENILLRVPNWIGDALMNLPAVRAVGTRFPDAKITVLAHPWVADLYRLVAEVDDILLYRKDRGIARAFSFAVTVAMLRERGFDLAILFQNAFEAAFMTALAGIPVRLGYDIQFRGGLLTEPIPVERNPSEQHQKHFYLRMLSSAGFSISDPDFQLRIPDSILRESDGYLPGGSVEGPPCLGFNLGAFSGSAKRWPPDFFRTLLQRILNTLDARIMVFGTHEIPEEERAIISRIAGSGRLTAYSMLPLLHLAGLISRCSIFITNDSGPMHLAASLDVPVVAIFGPTDEIQTGPLGRGHRIIRKKVVCSPCFHRECPEDHACMKTISPEEVYAVIESMFRPGETAEKQRRVSL